MKAAPRSRCERSNRKNAREVTSPMVHAPGSLTCGARPHRPRRTIPPAVAEMLADARRKHRWSIREAARRVNVAPGTIVHLEKARRAPSVIVAEDMIYGYRLGPAEARHAACRSGHGRGPVVPVETAAPLIQGHGARPLSSGAMVYTRPGTTKRRPPGIIPAGAAGE